MDTNRRTFIKGAVGTATALSLTGLGNAQEVITIGSDIPYRPFEFRNEQGEIIGFDVDIAEAIFVGQLGLEYEFMQTGFDTIIPSLNNGNFRIIMSAMTITEERAQQVDFSDPYFTAYQTVVVLQNSDIETVEDLRGQTVAVQRGTTGEAATEELQEQFDGDLTIDSYDQITGAFNALINNQAVAVINDNTVNAEFVNQNENVVFLEGEGAAAERAANETQATEEEMTGTEGEMTTETEAAGPTTEVPPYLTLTVEEYGIAFRQDDDEFREQVNEALAAIREDGTYDEIYNEWFGVESSDESEG